MIKVSIVVPVYNVQQYLTQCIDSILGQTLQEIEVICVDDGSTDQSGEILDNYATMDTRIQVIHKENAGYGHTMNLGMSLAKGEYIGIVESDDFVDLNMYEILYRKAKQDNLDVIKACYMGMYHSNEMEPKLYRKEITSQPINYGKVLNIKSMDVNFERVFATWSGIYRREFIEQNQIKHNETAGASYQDVGFSILTTLLSERLMYVEDSFYRYRMDNEGSSVKSEGKMYCVYEEYEYIRKVLERYPEVLERYRVNLRFKYMTHFKRDAKRIREDYIAEFVQFTKDYIIKCKRNNEYSEEWYGERDKKAYGKIETDTEEVIASIKEQRKNRMRIEYDAKNKANEYHEIVIYGAGNYGKEAYRQFQELEISYKVSAFAVTKVEQVEQCYEVPIKALEQIPNKDCLLIIAIATHKTDVIKQMRLYANQQGFKNVVSFGELLGDQSGVYIR